MKIAIFANEIARPGASGVKVYSLEIIKNLLRIDRDSDYTLYSETSISAEIGLDRQNIRYTSTRPAKRFWAFSVFAKLVSQDKPDVVFMPVQTFPFFSFGRNKPKVVITIHDAAFRLFPETYTYAGRKLLDFHTGRSARLADRIIVPSEATKRDIMRFYGINQEKINVIPHGYSENLPKMTKNREDDVKKLTKSCSYVLFVGTVQPRKNIVRLAEAFAGLKKTGKYEDLKLVILGRRGWKAEQVYQEIAKNPFADHIIFVNDADDELLAGFYGRAEFFVLPSLYEGFGLPVLEAMSFGLPVLCADNSSLSEVAGGAALLADGNSAEDLADKMKMLFSSQSLKAELSQRSLERVKSFSWERAARETLEVLKKA